MRIIYLSILILLVGCKNVEVRKVSETDIVRDEMSRMDWGNVDTYPTFEACGESTSKIEQKQCFGEKLTAYIMESLSQHEIILNDSLYEKMNLIIRISAEGKPDIEGMELSPVLQEKVKDLDGWLKEAVADLPKIYPAEKRGVPVSTKFNLPLIIEAN